MTSRKMRRANERRAAKDVRRSTVRTGTLAVGAGVALGASVVYVPPAQAAGAIEVTTTADSGAGSLRAAIAAADAHAGHDVITFAPSVTGTIELATGQLKGATDVTVEGPGADVLTIDAGGQSRVLSFAQDYYDDDQGPVVISGLTLTGGVADDLYDGRGKGGAVFVNAPSIELSGLVVSGNHAVRDGGGFATTTTAGKVVISDSTFTDNTADDLGGAINVDRADSFEMSGSVVSGNQADDGGGGLHLYLLYDSTRGLVEESLISGNSTAGDGGGVSIEAGREYYLVTFSTRFENTTITGNHADGRGGGVHVGDQADEAAQTFVSTTVARNTSPSVGGISAGDGTKYLVNSIVADNTTRDLRTVGTTDPFSLDHSLVEDPGSAVTTEVTPGSNLLRVDPQLGALADNGGPTATLAPVASSPVVDQGISSGLDTDQRGQARPVDRLPAAAPGDGADMGAVELGAGESPAADPDPVPDPVVDDPLVVTSTADSGPGSLRATLAEADEREGHDTVSFAPAVTGTIELTSGALAAVGDVTIEGPGAPLLTIDAGGESRVLELGADGQEAQGVVVSGLTLTGGEADGADYYYGRSGGAVLLAEIPSVELDGLVVTDSHASGEGGGISVNGAEDLTITASDISGNVAGRSGGGLDVTRVDRVLVDDMVLARNHAEGEGGGLHVDRADDVHVRGTLISGNTVAGNGGGLAITSGEGRVGFSTTVENTTITGNHADGTGGGAFVADLYEGQYGGPDAVLSFVGTTIARNTATTIGGLAAGDGAKIIRSSILADNTSRDLRLVSSRDAFVLDHSLVERIGTTPVTEESEGSNILGQDPALGALGDNGGPTATLAPAATSVVIDRGAAAGLSTDQRGEPRPVDRVAGPASGDQADMGAVELAVGESPSADPDPVPDPGPEQGTVVTTTADSGLGSLRAAVEAAAESGGAVTFAPDVTGTIELTSGAITAPGAEGLTIQGPGADVLTVDASGTSRIFSFTQSDTSYDDTSDEVAISGLTLTGGRPDADADYYSSWSRNAGGAVLVIGGSLELDEVVVTGSVAPWGGAVAAAGADLTVRDSRFEGNLAAYGGALIVGGREDVSITGSAFVDNRAITYGGAIDVEGAGTFELRASTVTGNSADGGGGGVRLAELDGYYSDSARAQIADSLISGNSTDGIGGGIGIFGAALYYDEGEHAPVQFATAIENTTITGNRADAAGGGVFLGATELYGDLPTTFTSTTIAANSSLHAGGIAAEDGDPVIRNSIVADNTHGDLRNVDSTDPFRVEFSLVEDAGTTPLDQLAGSNLLGVDPQLGTLTGTGPAASLAPTAASPVVDQGKSYGLTTDQRGKARPVDLAGRSNASDGADMGAVELSADTVVAQAPAPPVLDVLTPGPLQVSVSWVSGSDGGSPITGYAVQYRRSDTATWEAGPSVGPTRRSVVVGGLLAQKSYAFRVVATNAVGTSAPSGVLLATPTAATTTTPTPIPALPRPRLSAKPKAGKPVSAVFALPAGVSGATVSYAWTYQAKKSRKSTVVGHRTALKVKKAWKGGRLTLTVTVSKPGVPSRTVSVTARIR